MAKLYLSTCNCGSGWFAYDDRQVHSDAEKHQKVYRTHIITHEELPDASQV